MGDVGASKHAVGAVEDTHVSTETASFERHVECVDCHNVHEATSTPAPAPLAYGAIKGTQGVSVANSPAGQITYTQKPRIDNEYELCMKCHSGWSASTDTRNIAKEIDTRNASVHAIEETSTTSNATAGSFVSGWGNDSVLHCRDCHGTADKTAVQGPHASDQAPLLVKPYWGVTPSDASQLCFDCHRREVYFTGAEDGVPASTSRFYNDSGAGARQASAQLAHADPGQELLGLSRHARRDRQGAPPRRTSATRSRSTGTAARASTVATTATRTRTRPTPRRRSVVCHCLDIAPFEEYLW